MAPSAGEGLRASQEPHGVEPHVALWQAPLIVTRLCLKKPERMEALGVVFLVALRLGRLVERARRLHGETPGSPLTGWDRQATHTPTACMRMTQCAAVMGRKVGGQRHLAPPLSPVPQASLNALGVPATSLTLSPSG